MNFDGLSNLTINKWIDVINQREMIPQNVELSSIDSTGIRFDDSHYTTWTYSDNGFIWPQPMKAGEEYYGTVEFVFNIRSAQNNGGIFALQRILRTVYSEGSSFEDSLISTTYYDRSGITSISISYIDRNVAGIGGTSEDSEYHNGNFYLKNDQMINTGFGSPYGSFSVGKLWGGHSDMPVDFTFHALRTYNRILSPDEIMYTRKVDEIRYGLV